MGCFSDASYLHEGCAAGEEWKAGAECLESMMASPTHAKRKCGCPIPVEAFKARLDVALGSLVLWLVTLHVAGELKLDGHCGPSSIQAVL